MIDRRVPGHSILKKARTGTPRWICFCGRVFPSNAQLRTHRSACLRGGAR